MTELERIFPGMSRQHKAELGRLVCSNVKCAECPIQKECFGCLTERRGDRESFRDVSVHLAEWAMAGSRSRIATWFLTGTAFGFFASSVLHLVLGG